MPEITGWYHWRHFQNLPAPSLQRMWSISETTLGTMWIGIATAPFAVLEAGQRVEASQNDWRSVHLDWAPFKTAQGQAHGAEGGVDGDHAAINFRCWAGGAKSVVWGLQADLHTTSVAVSGAGTTESWSQKDIPLPWAADAEAQRPRQVHGYPGVRRRPWPELPVPAQIARSPPGRLRPRPCDMPSKARQTAGESRRAKWNLPLQVHFQRWTSSDLPWRPGHLA